MSQTELPIVIIGAGETAAIAYEYFTTDSPYKVAGFVVEREFIKEDSFQGLPIAAFEDIKDKFPPKKFKVFVAISSTKLNRIRTRLYQSVCEMGYECVSYISSRAFIWHDAVIGDNCFIFENNTVQPFVRIGNNVVLWSGNHIGHNTVIHDNCFIASHCVISGFCEIGENCFLGVNSTVINNIFIAKDCFIGASALIQKNTSIGEVYQAVGTPPAKAGAFRLFRIKEN